MLPKDHYRIRKTIDLEYPANLGTLRFEIGDQCQGRGSIDKEIID